MMSPVRTAARLSVAALSVFMVACDDPSASPTAADPSFAIGDAAAVEFADAGLGYVCLLYPNEDPNGPTTFEASARW